MSARCFSLIYKVIVRHPRLLLSLFAVTIVGLSLLQTTEISTLRLIRKAKQFGAPHWISSAYKRRPFLLDQPSDDSQDNNSSITSGQRSHLEQSTESRPLQSSAPISTDTADSARTSNTQDAAARKPWGSPRGGPSAILTLENETGEVLPNHWSPDAIQRHATHSHSATHPLNFDADDVLVFLHIPKTSGKTFNAHLVRDMKVPKRLGCKCTTLEKPHGCKCLNAKGHIWLFSRLTTAWPCGVHPSWSDLTTECLNQGMDRKEGTQRKRRFTMVTMLRSPYTRYISEWHQVKTDGQWRPFHRLRCYPLSKEQYCYKDDWRGVNLDQFLDCPSNPANNRQVRMLADLNRVNCSQVFDWLRVDGQQPMSERPDDNATSSVARHMQDVANNPLLLSAIHNLKKMAFFGLEEYQRETEYLFTRTFGRTFRNHFQQTRTFAEQVVISKEQREKLLDLNRLDLVLYRFAKELFFKRLHENVKRKHEFVEDGV